MGGWGHRAPQRLQPDSEEAVTTLAYLYDDEGDMTKALQTLNAIPSSARSAKVQQALGYTYELQHDYKKAISAYKRSVELDRENLDSARGLAQNLLNDGQTDAALQQYKSIAEAESEVAHARRQGAPIIAIRRRREGGGNGLSGRQHESACCIEAARRS